MSFDITTAFIPEIQNPYVNERSTTLSRLWQSGIVENSLPSANEISSGNGNRVVVPFNLSIEDEDAAVGSYTLANKITPTRIGNSLYTFHATTRAKSWTTADLDKIVAGHNPVGVLTEQMGTFWANNYQKDLLAQTQGIVADNIANDSGDMVNDIYSDVVAGSLTAANLVSQDAIIDAMHTMGDHRGKLKAVIMHSNVRKQLEKDEPNNFIPASATNIGFDTYLGLMVIEDDSMTVTAGSNTPSYDTILFGAGVFSYGADSRLIGEEWDRDTTSADGMGENFIVTRRRFGLHPQGFDYTLTNPEDMPTRANWASATNWARKVTDRKQIAMAVLRSNAL